MSDGARTSGDGQTVEARGMGGSVRIARVFGISIAIHWTFTLLIVYVIFIAMRQGADAAGVLVTIGFVLALFVCVVLHELGHALAGRAFGIGTRDITLLPIGGVARLERMPTEPWHEFWIAVAGPAVNVVIAAVLLAVNLALTGRVWPDFELLQGGEEGAVSFVELVRHEFVWQLAMVNIVLVLFNMLPSFPMDGGRVLRALLAMRLDHAQATGIAAKVGAVMAALFIVLGLFTWNLVLILIAVFVFLGGQAEAQHARTRSMALDARVDDAMVRDFEVLTPGQTLERAGELLLAGTQQDFPVVEAPGDRVIGLLTRRRLIEAVARGGIDTPVEHVMEPAAGGIRPDEPLERAIERIGQGDEAIPVYDRDRLVGLLTRENVSEFIMLRSALRQNRAERG